MPRQRMQLASVVLCCLSFGGLLRADEPSDASPDRYALPAEDADVEELLDFVQELKAYRPRTLPERLTHRLKAAEALTAAANRIMKLEQDESSEAYATATQILLEQQVQKLSRPDSDRKKVLDQLQKYLTKKAESKLTPDDLSLAMTAARNLEYASQPELAAETYQMLASLLRKQEDESQEATARLMEGAARRLRLVGKPLKLEGVTMEGEEFDWNAYRGKVVLVDFWATWCGPCLAELPNVQEHYDQYHERGFDVVGISLDRERKAIEQFLEKQPLPWVTLHHPQGGRHPMAEYYGINAIPTVLLVDREGKVVSLRARGNELDRLLGALIGPAEEPSSSEDEAAAK